jgi:hypothetical protein
MRRPPEVVEVWVTPPEKVAVFAWGMDKMTTPEPPAPPVRPVET